MKNLTSAAMLADNNTRTHGKARAALTAALSACLILSPVMPAIAETADSAEIAVVAQSSAGTFTFSNSSISASGVDSDAYSIDGTTLTIKAAGTYTLSGSCSDGSVEVKKGISGVTLVLNNLTLSKSGDKAIKFKAGSSGTITLQGTNTLSTSGDKGIIKANAEADDSDNIVYASDGSTTGGDLVINGSGTLNLSSSYSEVVDGETEGCDGINCEGDLTVLSGTFNINVTDDGMHSDNTLTIGSSGTSGPTINIPSACEGLEGATVNLLSGTGTIKTSDDGVNAANSDLVSYGWQYAVNISGGNWNVVAAGDGLDSNGNLTISGGTTSVYCTGAANGALDYGNGEEGEIVGSFSVSGGTLFAVGSDMAVTPSSGTYVMFGAQGGMGGMPDQQGGMPGQQGGMPGGGFMGMSETDDAMGMTAQATGSVVNSGQTTTVSVDNKTLYSTTASASGAYALFASSELTNGATVTLTSGSTTTTATVGGTGTAAPAQVQVGLSEGQMARLYNPNSGEHFYTSSQGEAQMLVNEGWSYEGIAWTAPSTGNPVYRLYNSNGGDHHYTTSSGERDLLIAAGWTFEGIGWYSSTSGTPVYRQYNPNATTGSHNYTTSAGERNLLIAAGWNDEGIGWYAV